MTRLSKRVMPAVAAALLLTSPVVALSCPFCSAVQQTFSEEIIANDVTVIVELVERPETLEAETDPFDGQAVAVAKSTFKIVEIIKGADNSAVAKGKQIDILYFGQEPVGGKFLVYGVDPVSPAWTTPTPLTDRGVAYVMSLTSLPDRGADRMAFFQEYLEDEDRMLAADAYDEFARAPYADVIGLKDRMHHDQLVEWIRDVELPASRRRLYLTMLGVCGTPDDVGLLQDMITTDDQQVKAALDALIACYLNLKGPAGLPLVVDRFIKNQDAEYTDTYSAIMALRFHGQEMDLIPRDDLCAALRHMLDRPTLADLVIPDLARWEDWSVMDRLVTLFKEADDQSSWVRVPVVNYLRACPLPEAEAHIAELKKIDPEAVKRASFFFPLGASGQAPAPKPADKATAASGDAAGAENEAGDEEKKSATPAAGGSSPSQGAVLPALANPVGIVAAAALFGGLGVTLVFWLVRRVHRRPMAAS